MESWGEFSCPPCPGDHGDLAGMPIAGGRRIFLALWGVAGMSCDAPRCFPGQTLVSSPFQSSPREAPRHCREGRPGALAPAQVPGPV